jgi:hypothetical protein
MDPRLKFLMALRNLYNAGAIKTVQQAYDFAKNQFGQLDDLFKRQIEQVFKKPIDKAPKPGEGGITSIKNAPKKETTPQASGVEPVNPYRPKKGLDPVEGMTRTAARVILDRYGIKYPEKADPINVFEENFGGDALMDLKDVGEELLEKETRGKITESMGEFLESRGMFNLKVDKTARKGMTDEELIKKLTDDVDEAYGVDADMKRELDKLNNKYQGEEFDRLYDDYLYYKNEEGNFTGSFEDFIKARRKAGSLDAEMIRLKEQEDIDKAIEQEDILLDFDPKGRKPNAFGGFNRVGYAEGPENPKKKKGVMSVIKKIPRVGKLAAGLETIMSKFGPDAIGTLEDFYKKGKLKLDPNVKKYQDDKKAVFDFNMRQLNKTEADANKKMDDIIKDQIEGGFIRDMEKSMQKDMQRELRKGKFTAAEILLQRLKNTLKNEKDPYVQENFPTFIKEIEANPKLAEDPKVQEAFGLRDLPENQRLVEYNDGTFDFYTQGSKKGMGSVKALADEFGISIEEAMKIKTMEPEDQILEIERRRALNKRKLNAEGGLNYLMGM